MALDDALALDAVRVCEAAAVAAAGHIGRGDEKAADRAAVDAMRAALNRLAIRARVAIGEGERDRAPMLYIGEQVGSGSGAGIDIALDPLEGTTICATGGTNALAVLAFAERGGFLHAPDTYMEKIAVGGGLPAGVVGLDRTPADNLARLAAARGGKVAELTVTILDRPRHRALIAAVREAGARIRLIRDGDVAGVIATARPETGTDLYMGTGGAPEGVLAAAALRCIGGQFQGRLAFRNDEEKARARAMGIADAAAIYDAEALAGGDVVFAATGVTDGWMLKGVHRDGAGLATQSIVMRSASGTVRVVSAWHDPARKSFAATA